MKKWLPHAGIVIGICIAIYALFFNAGEEARIRSQLDALEDAVEVSAGGENLVLRAARIKKAFKGLFVKNVKVRIPELSNIRSGRSPLAKLAIGAPRVFEVAHLDLSELTITLDEGEKGALAFGAALLSGARHSNDFGERQRTVSLRFDKIDGAWLIVSVSVSSSADGG